MSALSKLKPIEPTKEEIAIVVKLKRESWTFQVTKK